MVYKKLRIIPSFCSRSNKGGLAIPETKAALLLLSALSLSSLAHGQATGITINALPYVLTNQGGVTVVTTYPLQPTPKEVSQSSFSSLMGGGFSAVLPNYSESLGAVLAVTAVRKATIAKNAANATKWVKQFDNDALNAQAEENTKISNNKGSCSNSVRANPLKAAHVSSRIMALRVRNALPKLVAMDTCTLPEEQEEEEAEAELEALNESEVASQEALESAEEAVEAAEIAAEAAETAAESALEAIDVLEAILETCALF